MKNCSAPALCWAQQWAQRERPHDHKCSPGWRGSRGALQNGGVCEKHGIRIPFEKEAPVPGGPQRLTGLKKRNSGQGNWNNIVLIQMTQLVRTHTGSKRSITLEKKQVVSKNVTFTNNTFRPVMSPVPDDLPSLQWVFLPGLRDINDSKSNSLGSPWVPGPVQCTSP